MMKNLTRIMLAVLLCIVGKGVAQAEVITDPAHLSNNKVYTVRTQRGGMTLNYEETMLVADFIFRDSEPNDDVSETEGANQFAILKFGDFYYIYSPLLEQFADLSGGSMVFQAHKGTGLSFTNDGTCDALPDGFEGSTLRLTLEEEGFFLNNNGSGGIVLNGWNTADEGNILAIEEVEGATFDLAKAEEVFAVEKPEYSWWALIKNPHKVFNLSTARAGFLTCDEGRTTLIGTVAYPDASDEEQQFAFYQDAEGKVYLYSVGANMFLDKNGKLTSIPSEMAEIGYEEDADENYPIVFYIKETKFRFNSQTDGTIKFDSYTTHDEGNRIGIEEVEGVDAYDQMMAFFSAQRYEITYRLMFNDEEIMTCTREMPHDSEAQLPADMIYESCWYEYDPETITSDADVTVNVYWNGPEDLFSKSLDDANWFNLLFDRSKHGGENQWYAWYEEGKTRYYPKQNADEATRAAAQCQWAFVGNPYEVKIYNKAVGEGQTLGYTPETWEVTLQEGEHLWSARNWHEDTEEFSLGIVVEGGEFRRINQFGGDKADSFFGIWGGYDDGSKLTVEEAPNIDVTDVTFDIYYEGQKVASEKVIGCEVGDWIPELPASLQAAFVDLDYDEGQTIDNEDYHVEVQATWNGPFELSKDFGSAHWYNMAMRGNYYVTSDQQAEDGALKTVKANALGLGEDAYQWALVGDPWHIRLYNKAKGDMVFGATGAEQNQGIPAFQDEDYTWGIVQSTSDIPDAFLFNVKGTNLYINQYGGAGGSVKFWASAYNIGDPGSAFTVFEVPTDYAEFVEGEISPMMESETKWFNWTDDARAQIGYQPSYKESCPFETYKNIKLAIEELSKDESNFVFPPSGFYRLQNSYYEDFMGYVSEAPMGSKVGTDATTVVKLTKVGDREYEIQIQGEYLQPLVQSETMYPDPAYPATFRAFVPVPGVAAFTATEEPDESDEEAVAAYNYSFIHRRAAGDYVGWEKNAAASQFRLLDAPTIAVEVPADGIASLYVPFAVQTPEGSGIAAFTGKIGEDAVAMTQIKDIPAATAVVLLADEGTYELPILSADVAAIEGNDLKGTYFEARPAYALAPQSTGLDDCYFGDTGEDLPANSAYVKLADTSLDQIPMVFDDLTGIKSVETSENHTMFDLSGRRVNKANKGVYIIDGKKMMVK